MRFCTARCYRRVRGFISARRRRRLAAEPCDIPAPLSGGYDLKHAAVKDKRLTVAVVGIGSPARRADGPRSVYPSASRRSPSFPALT